MFILDFDKDARQAFAHGFLKGLAAPASLYHSETLPIVHVQYVQPSTAQTATEAIRTDWRQIGHDLRGVIDNEQTRKQTTIPQAAKKQR